MHTLEAATSVSLILLTLPCDQMLQASIISTKIIPYDFPSKLSDELFSFVYFAAYSYLPGCRAHNSLAPRISASSLWPVRHCLSGHISCVPQHLNSRQNG